MAVPASYYGIPPQYYGNWQPQLEGGSPSTSQSTVPQTSAAPQQPQAQTQQLAGGASAGGGTGYNYGFGPSGEQMQLNNDPYRYITNSPNAAAPQEVRNSFMPATFTAPYYNAAGVAGNLGTMMTEGVAPQAVSFMQDMFNPNLNTMEQSFLGAGMNNASRLLEQAMGRNEMQYEDTPFHSGLQRQQGDTMNQFANDLVSQGAQLGLNRQNTAAQMSQFPFTYGLQAAQVGPNMSERMFNMYNSAFQQGTQLPLSVYTQIPVPSPVVTQSQGGKM